MSLYPPSPRNRGPPLRGGEALDALSCRFSRWCDLVEASKVTAALGSAAHELRTIRDAGFLSSLGSPGAHRRWDVASACWKHWRHFVLLSKARAPLTSALVEHECAVLAFKHWRFAARGRPVAHDACVVVAWKHWRFLCTRIARERDAKAEALRETLARRRFLKIKWEDETANRANRRAYELETRRRRLDAFYGLDPESEYGSAARASSTPTRRFRDVMTPTCHSRSSRAFSGWRRFVARSKARERSDASSRDAFEQKRAADARDADAASRSRRAEAGEAPAGTSAVAVASAAARRAARLEWRFRERRALDASTARRPNASAEAEKEAAEAREREEANRKRDAATAIQASFRGFAARNRASTLRERRDAYALERVRGLRALLDRGEATFAADARAHAAAARRWSESEARLASLRFRNEEAMTRVALARSTLAASAAEAKAGRARVAREATSRLKTHGEWNALWAPLREWNDPTRTPFPSLPERRNRKENADARRARRKTKDERRARASVVAAGDSPLDDVAFGRHAPPDETAYERTV